MINLFQNHGRASPSDQIHSLLEHLKKGGRKKYRGFLYALSETDQLQVTKEILGEDVPDLFMLETPQVTQIITQVKTNIYIFMCPQRPNRLVGI